MDADERPFDDECLLGRHGGTPSFPRRAEASSSGESVRGLPAEDHGAVIAVSSRLLRRFPDADIAARPELTLLANSDEKGVCIAEDSRFRRLYVLDHLEYDSGSLADEYFRDIKAEVPIKLPFNYFQNDDTSRPPPNRWRSHAH